MRRLIIILTLSFLAVGSASGRVSRSGASGAQFLSIGVGPRYQGLGEASVAVVNDIYATYWNPAGLTNIENSSLTFTNVNWLLDIDLNYVAYALNVEDIGVFAVSATILSVDDQEITTFENQTGTGETYDASSYAIGFSYAQQLTAKFSFGATGKYIGERIYNETSSGFAFDFGTLLHTGFRSLRFGMSITNMGPELRFNGPDLDIGQFSYKTTPYDLPMMFRVGLAYDWELGSNSVVTAAAELKHPTDREQQGAFGMEYAFANSLFLRSGYKVNYDEEGLSLGGGLKRQIAGETSLLIDYAWQDFGRLESTHRFSIGFNF